MLFCTRNNNNNNNNERHFAKLNLKRKMLLHFFFLNVSISLNLLAEMSLAKWKEKYSSLQKRHEVELMLSRQWQYIIHLQLWRIGGSKLLFLQISQRISKSHDITHITLTISLASIWLFPLGQMALDVIQSANLNGGSHNDRRHMS